MLSSLLIDDLRDLNVDKICRTYQDGINALCSKHWNVLYLDHDLGENRTGYNIICWLEEHEKHRPDIIICISSNPVGYQRINQVIKKIYGKIFTNMHIKSLIL